jgi:cell division septation protein DedD
MRIDYSEPKKSYVTSQGSARPRKEPARLFTSVLVVTCVITFIAGFGSGWFLSQKSAKKSFQAATEQNSLENSPRKEAAPPKPALVVQPLPQPQQQPDTAATQQPPPPPVTSSEPPLSFYKTLPSGQKGNVLGSGINTKDEKAKQPLQAPIPANVTKPPAAEPQKPATEKPAVTETTTAGSGFTVQVASFPLKSEAETLKTKLAGKGYNVTVSESHLGDKGTWYRVRVGRKLDQEAAKELAGKLGKGALVIPD